MHDRQLGSKGRNIKKELPINFQREPMWLSCNCCNEFRRRNLWCLKRSDPGSTILVATICIMLQPPVTCPSDLTPSHHSTPNNTTSHSGACFVNHVKPPPAAPSLHNPARFCHSVRSGVNSVTGNKSKCHQASCTVIFFQIVHSFRLG